MSVPNSAESQQAVVKAALMLLERMGLRYADGRPITSRRYDHLWCRIGRHLPWVATQGISTHWIRHILSA